MGLFSKLFGKDEPAVVKYGGANEAPAQPAEESRSLNDVYDINKAILEQLKGIATVMADTNAKLDTIVQKLDLANKRAHIHYKRTRGGDLYMKEAEATGLNGK